jgi:hypothetical protein
MDINASPEWQCHHCWVKVNDLDIFRNKQFFSLNGFRESKPETKPRTLIAHPLWRETMRLP